MAKTEEALLFDTLQRSQPSLVRPRLATGAEERLAAVEARSRETYARLEVLTNKCATLAETLPSDTEVDSPEAETWDDDESLVTHLEELHKQTSQEIVLVDSPKTTER